jgi:hypothetical protein
VDEAFINDKPCEERLGDIIKYNIGTVIIDGKHKDHYLYLEEHCKLLSFDRTEGVSTTKIKEKIKDYGR